MREIKFRAWDKRNLYMFYNVQNGITFNDDSHYKFSDFLCDTDRWEVMQYAGLKDENGVEIYEGDILKLTAVERYPDENVTTDVLWNCKEATFCMRAYRGAEHGLPINWGGWVKKEILGNIHEHPHLLDNTTENV